MNRRVHFCVVAMFLANLRVFSMEASNGGGGAPGAWFEDLLTADVTALPAAPVNLDPGLAAALNSADACQNSGKADVAKAFILNVVYIKQLGQFVLSVQSKVQNSSDVVQYLSAQIVQTQQIGQSALATYQSLVQQIQSEQANAAQLVGMLSGQLNNSFAVSLQGVVRDDACRADIAPAALQTLIPAVVGKPSNSLSWEEERLRFYAATRSLESCEASTASLLPADFKERVADSFQAGTNALNEARIPWRRPEERQARLSQLQHAVNMTGQVGADIAIIMSGVGAVQQQISQEVSTITQLAAQAKDAASQVAGANSSLQSYNAWITQMVATLNTYNSLIQQAQQEMSALKAAISGVDTSIYKPCGTWLQNALNRVNL